MMYNGRFYTIINSKLFDESNKNKLFVFNHPLPKDEEVKHEEIGDTGMINIYSVPKSLMREHSQISHRATTLIMEAMQKSKQDNTKQLYIDIRTGFFYANMVENSRLFLSNAFEYDGGNELAYFVMALFSKFGLDPKKSRLFVSGETNEGQAGLELLKDFIYHIEVNEAVSKEHG